MKIKTTLLVLGTVLLAACGDSPQETAAPPLPPAPNASDLPNLALSSATAFSQFAASLPKTEIGQPLNVNGVTPPTSETADPIPVM